MLERFTQNILDKALARAPAVALLGARQVGKTTLAHSIASSIDSVYLDLENPADAVKLSDASGFLRAQGDRLVILDEIQRAPDIFEVLRGVIDDNRQAGRRAGQFLLLGSASRELLRQSSESLAGRIRYIEMTGLNALEVGGGRDARQNLWVRGGFPESYLASDDGAAMEWLEDFIRTYLERDIPQAGLNVPAERLRRFWTMLAHMQGELVNASTLATNLAVSGKTVSRYLDVLVDLLLVRRLEPYHANVKKRLVKSPRYYVRDSGVLHRLLGVGTHNALLSHPVLGKSWEGFVIENIHSVLPRLARSYFYRTAAGAEIDLVLEMPNSEVWAVEIKYGVAPKLGKHFRQTCADIGATHKYVVYGGTESFSLGDDIETLPLNEIMQRLQNHA